MAGVDVLLGMRRIITGAGKIGKRGVRSQEPEVRSQKLEARNEN